MNGAWLPEAALAPPPAVRAQGAPILRVDTLRKLKMSSKTSLIALLAVL